MKRPLVLWLFACVLISFLPAKQAEASHALGAEITYECLGGNQYLIRMVFYRDCGGIDAPTAPSINITSSCGNQVLGMTLQPPEPHFPPFDQYLANYELPVYCSASNCNGGSNPGIQEYVYEATVNLAACDDWTFSYDLCCRSDQINTIGAPGSEDIYVNAFLNNLDAPCNSSPQFDVPARGFICLNEDNTILASAYDVDGDLLVYSLYTPWTNAGQSVNYNGGYNPNNPLNNNYYNFSDGVITTQPTSNGQITVIGVMVEEYRNGVLIGRIVRDMQVRVINNCPQNPGNDFDIDQDGLFDSDTIVICSDTPLQLDVYLNNTLPGLTYNMVAENIDDFPGATFNNVPNASAPGGIVGEFVWTPDQSDIGTNQVLVFTAFDDNCPVVGFANFTYEFIITGLELDVDIDTVAISCTDSVEMNTLVSNGFPPYTYLWNDGETTASRWVTAGEYIVTVTDSEGCTGDDTINVFYIDDPVSIFDAANACVDSVVQLNDQSYSNYPVGFPPIYVVDWAWDMGDGTTITGVQNPTHTYTASGDYTVQLIATNDLGCVDTSEQTIWANPPPDVGFQTSNVCSDTLFTFTDVSTIDTGQVVSWAWGFGDASPPAVTQNGTHQYAATGYYDVTLVAMSDSGCPAAITQEVYAFPIPVTDFGPTDVCEGNVSSFTDLTTVSAGTIEGWQWDFGDGASSTIQNPVHTYGDTGVYNVTLISYTDSVCTDTLTQSVTVYAAPTADFTTDTVCAELLMTFTDQSTVPVGAIVSWTWHFGDGDQSTDQSTTHVYALGGVYTVSLIVESDLGCIDTMMQSILVYPKPNAEFGSFAACQDDENQFTDQSLVATGSSITGWEWDFGDAIGTSSTQNPIYTFDTSGVYTVTLISETNFGCLDTVSHTTEVYDLPVSDFSFSDVCLYDAAVYSNNSSIVSGSITNYYWDFGDGDSSTVQQPVGQEYLLPGFYDIELQTVSNHGCLDTLTQTIEIFPVPTAMFAADTVCFPLATTFTDLSTVGGVYNVTDWVWKFGDGIIETGVQHPTHAYAVWGDYSVQLTVTSDAGCMADT
ncbi:MAG: PKD domain-containing protein, partial [Flavobacteriales bacterium]